MNFEMLHPADQIVMIMNRIYYHGMTTTTGGNLSIRDSEGTVWISPSGVDKGNLRREDIMQIKPDGTIIGIHRPSVEYPFHLAIYKKRPDLKAVLHAHPPALVAFSLLRQIPDNTIIPDAKFLSGNISIADYALPGSSKLGDNISAEFAKGSNTVMLENHGVVIGAKTLFKAFMSFEMLDFCARIQINAKALGGKIRNLSAAQLDNYKSNIVPKYETFVPEVRTSEELAVRREMCDLIHRAYGNQLFTSDMGTFSCKLSDGSFVVTPSGKDRAYLEPEDLVLINKEGKCEEGKKPSRSFVLHKIIYNNDPEIKTVIIARPPHIMAFAVTDTEFDARLIPESYIALKTVRKRPFGASYQQPETFIKDISIKDPVLLIENDSIIAVGTNMLNAFDRLEVLEYSAKSLVQAASLGGEVVKISPDEVREIEVAFNL